MIPATVYDKGETRVRTNKLILKSRATEILTTDTILSAGRFDL